MYMKDFAAIDFETANECRSSVCSVGVVIVKDSKVVDKFYSLIHPIPDYLFYCTCRASRSVLGNRHPNPQLQTVAQYCGYDLTYHHHALTDAEACTWIALEILDF